PTRKTMLGSPPRDPSPTGNGPVAGFTTKPAVKKPMKAMKRPIPTPIARLSPSGTASIAVSRKRVSTRSVIARPSRKATVIAWGHVSPRPATSSKATRSEEHTSELQSRENLVCRLLLEKKKKENKYE